MQILSKFYHNKHLTRLFDNSAISRYFTITMHKCVVIQQCYFYKKQVVIPKNIIINSKANKYQQKYMQMIFS